MKNSITIRHQRKARLILVSVVLGATLLSTRLPSPIAAPISAQQNITTEPEYLTPVDIKISSDGKKLFVVCEGSNSLLAVDPQTRQIVARVTVGQKPRGLALSPDFKTV